MYIGIDLGTSSVKLLLMGEKGEVIKTASRSYPVEYPKNGWSQQNPEDWLSGTLDGMAELLNGVNKAEVNGIGVGGQMHGLVILDENDNVLRPAILWNDGRTEKETEYLNTVIGKDKLSEYTANIAFAGFTAPKILWVKNNEPEIFAKIAKIMLPKDYLVYKLTGEFVTDVSDASGMLLLDVENRKWSKEMCDICSVTEDMLPALHESADMVGRLKAEYCEQLGLSDVVFAAGAGDNAAAAVGCGIVGEGGCNISLGTSGTLFISGEKFRVDSFNALHSFDHADGGYHLMGCMLSAASCCGWWVEKILGTKDYESVGEGIDEKLGEGRVYFLPYLMGERSPLNDVNARGAFIGMTPDTGKNDMFMAVLEGVAFGLRDSLEVARKLGLDVKKSKVCGGGAKNKTWLRILANVLNLTLEVPAVEEGPSMGGAILAAVADGRWENVKSAADDIVKIKETVTPDPALTAKYEEKYQIFKTFYPALKECFCNMNK